MLVANKQCYTVATSIAACDKVAAPTAPPHSHIPPPIHRSPGAGPSQATSVALALARLVTDTPLLVVKPNSAGELFQTPEQPGISTPIKVGSLASQIAPQMATI